MHSGIDTYKIVIVLACVLADVWLVNFCISVVFPAVKSGIYPARGRIYLREMHPKRFWLAAVFFPSLTVLMLACTVVLLF